ncbi:MAG: lipid-binding SYLF domain-containing protein [Candidatus Omnitrophica bacterium]|nr:lipid-binding SYLF domain-containing protein [Candidatus Omnitrophota bacterium]
MRTIVICMLFFCLAVSSFAATKADLVKRIKNSEETIKYMMRSPDTSIPQYFLKEAYAAIFLKQYKAGFVLGAKGGNGIILAKDRKTGEWSPPSFIATAEGSVGFQIGGKVVDAILLIMNEEGLTLLLKSKLKIGGEVSAAAGPVGREAGVKAGLPATGILIYSRARGAFIGASFEGGFIMPDDEANRMFYGIEDIKAREILLECRVEMPQEAMSLINTLQKYESLE